jgi:small GTP-binding protein
MFGEASSAARRAAATGESSMPTGSGSGGRLRKATPRAIARRTGNRKTQKIASGSRRNSRRRAKVSCTSGEESGPRARQLFMPPPLAGASAHADRRATLERPPGQGDEEILEGRVVRSQATNLEAALRQAGEKGWHDPMDLPHGEANGGAVATDRLESGQVCQHPVGQLAVALELDDVLGTERRDQLGRRAESENPAAIDDRHAIAQPCRLLHVVRGEQDRTAARLQLLDDLPDLPARGGVEPGGRLIEKEHLRIADQRTGERQALLLPAGELAYEGPTLLLEADRGERLLGPEPLAIEAAKQLGELDDAELLGEACLLQLHAETAAQPLPVALPALAQDLERAAVGREQSLEELDGGGLAGAVRTQKPEALARFDGEIETVHRHQVAVALHQAAASERRDAPGKGIGRCGVGRGARSHRANSTRGRIQPRQLIGSSARRPRFSARTAGPEPMPPASHIRNFSIIAHIDHGKSTLADRILERTGAVTQREMHAQLLDDMDLERERGITIKARAVRLDYKAKDGETYVFNLIDTPGHVDFSYEVSRSLAACEGALLIVDAAQGVEAQTLANAYLAVNGGLELVPVINKIDLPSADIDRAKEQVEQVIGIDASNAVLTSAKTGIGIDELLERIVTDVPPPTGDPAAPLKALLFDSWYDTYRGVACFIRVIDGTLKRGDKIKFVAAGRVYTVEELGTYHPKPREVQELSVGEVGYVYANIRDLIQAKIGDTVTHPDRPTLDPYPGFRK